MICPLLINFKTWLLNMLSALLLGLLLLLGASALSCRRLSRAVSGIISRAGKTKSLQSSPPEISPPAAPLCFIIFSFFNLTNSGSKTQKLVSYNRSVFSAVFIA